MATAPRPGTTRAARSGSAAALCVATAMGAASCQVIFGLDDYETGGSAERGGSGGATATATAATTGDGGGTSGTATSGGGAGQPCACAAAPPGAWEGPFYVLTQAGTEVLDDTCPDATAIIARVGEGPPEPACSPCACGGVTGVSCTVPALQCYGEGHGNCTAASVSLPPDVGDGDCHFIAFPEACKLGALSQPVGGGCAVSGGQPDRVAWTSVHNLCAAVDPVETCPAGGVCIVPPVADAELCIRSSGSTACPTGWAAREIPGHDGAPPVVATCGACACDAPVGVGCSPHYDLAVFGGCGSVVTSIGTTTCQDAANLGYARLVGMNPSLDGASCQSSGGQLEGVTDPGPPVTLCCVEKGTIPPPN